MLTEPMTDEAAPAPDVAFMRTGNSNPLGKLDAENPKFRIGSETLARLQLKAAEAGMTLAEYERMVLEANAWGAEHVVMLHADRVRRVVGSVR